MEMGKLRLTLAEMAMVSDVILVRVALSLEAHVRVLLD